MRTKPYSKKCLVCGGPAYDCATRCHHHTPTTEEVKRNYSDGWRDAKFDRWLEAHAAEVTAQAEARIIELLIDKASEWRNADLHQQAGYIDFVIALIKGETE